MKYSQVFCALYFIARVTGICPYSAISDKNSTKNLKLSSTGRWYCICYCLVLPANAIIINTYFLRHLSTESVKDIVTITFCLTWTVVTIGLTLNQLFNFKFLKRPIQFILKSNSNNHIVSKHYSAVIVAFPMLVIMMLIMINSLYPWNKPYLAIFWMFTDYQVECWFATTVFLLHIFNKYLALILQSVCDEVSNAVLKTSRMYPNGMKMSTPTQDEVAISSLYSESHKSSTNKHEASLKMHMILREITHIRKVIDDFQKYFQIPATLMTMWTVVIFTSYLLFCLGLQGQATHYIFYRYTAMALQISEILLLVDSQHQYNKAVIIF